MHNIINNSFSLDCFDAAGSPEEYSLGINLSLRCIEIIAARSNTVCPLLT